VLGLAASFVAGLAALVASQVHDADYAPFFIGLSLAGAVEAWAAREPRGRSHRLIARGAAVLWLVAAVWVGVLLAWEASYYAASRPPQEPEATYLGLPVTAYYVAGLYGGVALMLVSAFGTARRRPPEERTATG
jgi:hypothetical protein